MKTQLCIQERLKDLRVEKGMTNLMIIRRYPIGKDITYLPDWETIRKTSFFFYIVTGTGVKSNTIAICCIIEHKYIVYELSRFKTLTFSTFLCIL